MDRTRDLRRPTRDYESSHPWLAFHLDLREAPTELWTLLGEARSKMDHIAGVPLLPDVARDLHQLFLAKGALATTAIEGNTLTEQQVIDHLRGTLELPESQRYLAQEVDNIVAACNAIRDAVFSDDLPLASDTIQSFNETVLAGLDVEAGVRPGAFREHEVTVGGIYRGAPAQDVSFLVERLCEWLNGPDFLPAGPLDGMMMALVKAVVAHLYLAWIHPFGDGNGRTARLVEFEILVASGVSTPGAHLMSNHYNQTRSEYYRRLQAASREGEVVAFLVYAIRGFVDGLAAQLDLIRGQQWRVAWENYVHDQFSGARGDTARRRRMLALSLSTQEVPVSRAGVRVLSPELAVAYANKTDKTVTRDLNALVAMKLVIRVPGGVIANRDLILAFLPARRVDAD